ncbi:MAG: hypothetical protein ACRC7O_05940, partial [Fimbriiglobus sp.]
MTRFSLRGLAASAAALALTAAPAPAQLLVSSFFDSAIYQYEPTSGTLQSTLIAPGGGVLVG